MNNPHLTDSQVEEHQDRVRAILGEEEEEFHTAKELDRKSTNRRIIKGMKNKHNPTIVNNNKFTCPYCEYYTLNVDFVHVDADGYFHGVACPSCGETVDVRKTVKLECFVAERKGE